MVEITGDLPPFLKPVLGKRALEAIENWREKHHWELTKREEILKGYRITEGVDEEGKPRGTDRGNMGIEYRFKTVRQGNWQILISEPIEYIPPPVLEDYQRAKILKKLTTRQIFPQPTSQEEAKHQRVVDFFQANWEVLAGIFYPLEVEKTADLVGFSEVELNGRRLDFIGIGPDGRYIVLEIGKGGKALQLEGYKQDLIKMGIPEQMIMAFRVSYSQSSWGITLIVESK